MLLRLRGASGLNLKVKAKAATEGKRSVTFGPCGPPLPFYIEDAHLAMAEHNILFDSSLAWPLSSAPSVLAAAASHFSSSLFG